MIQQPVSLLRRGRRRRPLRPQILLYRLDRMLHHLLLAGVLEVIKRRAYGFRNFGNYRLRVRALCG